MDRRQFIGGSVAAFGLSGSPPATVASSPETPPTPDRLEIRVGVGLIRPLFMRYQTKAHIPLFLGIQFLRTHLAAESVVMPLVRIRDSLQLPANDWQIVVAGRVAAAGSIAESQRWNSLNHLPILRQLATAVREFGE